MFLPQHALTHKDTGIFWRLQICQVLGGNRLSASEGQGKRLEEERADEKERKPGDTRRHARLSSLI